MSRSGAVPIASASGGVRAKFPHELVADMGKAEENTETCGRCAMSSVAGVMEEEHDPFAGGRIEVDDGELRAVSPGVWLGRIKSRLDDWATRITYGR
jgi:hypothetical protein